MIIKSDKLVNQACRSCFIYSSCLRACQEQAAGRHDKRMNDYPLSILFLLFFKLLKVLPDIESGAN